MNKLSKLNSLLETKVETETKVDEATDSKEMIKTLVDTNFSGSNEDQGKAVQLLKGLAFSEDPISNKLMKKLDQWFSDLDLDSIGDEEVEEANGKKITIVVTDDTMGLINRDKKALLAPILKQMVSDIKSDVTNTTI